MPLLTTKLYIPHVRPGLVSRPRLVGRLNEGLPGQNGAFARKLTLVSAPAGFGKTTLLSEWVHGVGAVTAPLRNVAWLSLNKDDNDPTRFWPYFIAALQTPYPTVGEPTLAMLQSPHPLPIESVLTALINEIAEQSAQAQPCVLVLDDYHVIEAQPIHEGITFLLEHQPRQLHLVLSTRADPPVALARLRGRGQLTELRADDLRFTSGEAAVFLNQTMNLNLTPEDVESLEAPNNTTRRAADQARIRGLAIDLRGMFQPTDLGEVHSHDEHCQKAHQQYLWQIGRKASHTGRCPRARTWVVLEPTRPLRFRQYVRVGKQISYHQ